MCHTTHGTFGAWDDDAQIYTGLFSMVTDETMGLVGRLIDNIHALESIDTFAQLN
jgi:hypothetical protein